jgi:hypothetical protein
MAVDETPAELDREIAALEEMIELEGFDPELLGQAESLLRNAFHTFGTSTVSPSGIFSGQRGQRGGLKLKKCSSNWTRMVYASATRPAQFSRPPIAEFDFRSSRVVAIVNELPEQQLCWVRHCFMPDGAARAGYTRRSCQMFWAEYAAVLSGRLDRVLLQQMAQIQVFGYCNWQVELALEVEPLWSIVGMSKANWNARYAPHWRTMTRQLQLLHRRSLTAVLNRY